MKKVLEICVVLFALVCAVLASANAQPEMVKNVIVMISDGCGINHILATNYWHEASQVYQTFPVQLFMSTYSQDDIDKTAPEPPYDPAKAWADFGYLLLRPTDSASAATAMSTGVKTYDTRINIGPTGDTLFTVAQRATQLGKSTGVVTSVQWSHATPAGFVAHNISRSDYVQIAQEMLASDLDVIMGCGHPYFNDNHMPVTPSESKDWKYVGGQAQWDSLINGQTDWELIEGRAEFLALMNRPNPPARVCGTAECRTSLQEARSRAAGEGANLPALPYSAPRNDVPTLEEMTRAALNVLDENPRGFFLMVEGGAVDRAGHDNMLNRCIEEQTEFNEAIEAVVEWVETNSHWNETLLIVTSDHETGYLWGPGSGEPNSFVEMIDNGAGNLPGGHYYTTHHSNSLVPLFAKGASSRSFDLLANEFDPVRGAYIDNTEIGTLLFSYYRENLAARLSGFQVIAYCDSVVIRWATSFERNNDRFEMERDGVVAAAVKADNRPMGSSYCWVDSSVRSGASYSYSLYSTNIGGVRERLTRETATVGGAETAAISTYALYGNWPNPFNTKTKLCYDVTPQGEVRLMILDLLGRSVATLANGLHDVGRYEVTWEPADLPSGVYVCRMEAPGFVQTRKMLLVK
ncbi:MAG: alkaline phosphatase [bacterium]